jgi:hypothetical protein
MIFPNNPKRAEHQHAFFRWRTLLPSLVFSWQNGPLKKYICDVESHAYYVLPFVYVHPLLYTRYLKISRKESAIYKRASRWLFTQPSSMTLLWTVAYLLPEIVAELEKAAEAMVVFNHHSLANVHLWAAREQGDSDKGEDTILSSVAARNF